MLLAGCMLLGLTQNVAAYQTDNQQAINQGSIGHNDSHLEEAYPEPQPLIPGKGQYIEKTVTAVNDNTVDCYVRAKILYSDSDIGNALTLVQLDTENWTYISMDDDANLGGYYYYHNSIKPGEKTTPLFAGVTISGEADYHYQTEEDDFEILVYEESIEKNTYVTYEEAWKAYITM